MILEALTILLIGDSHLQGQMGKTLQSQLAQKNTVHLYAVCGSHLKGWIQGGQKGCQNQGQTVSVKSLVAQLKPDLVIYSLGTNSILNPASLIEKEVQNLSNIPTKCLWIGPPAMAKFNASILANFYHSLVNGLAPGCGMVDSEVITQYPPAGDGLHYWGQYAKDWGQSIYQLIKNR